MLSLACVFYFSFDEQFTDMAAAASSGVKSKLCK